METVFFSAKTGGSTVPSANTIRYESITENAGSGMDANIGVFTVPIAGAYYFTFSAVANGINTKVQLKLNGAIVGSAFGSKELDVMALVRIIVLNKGDTVWLDLLPGGSIWADYGATFTGRLLPPNSVYFDVGRNSDFENTINVNDQLIKDTKPKVLPFQPSTSIQSVNAGGGMNAAEGIFTPSVNVAYHFPFSGLSYGKEDIRLRLTVNNVAVASTWGKVDKNATLSLATIVKLNKGDRVSMQVYPGYLRDDPINSFTHFIGYLIKDEESCTTSSECIYFEIGRKSVFQPLLEVPILLTYDNRVVLGSEQEVDSGVFTVSHSGTYQFTFSGLADKGDTLIELTLNGERIGESYGYKCDTLWIFDLIDAKKGDKVAIRITGALYDSNNLYTHFTGQLVMPKC